MEISNALGFTLKICLIAAMLGILSISLIPLYKKHHALLDRRRVEASLYQLSNRMNEYYSLQGDYQRATAQVLGLSELNKNPGYQLHIVRHGKDHFTLTATPIGSQKKKEKHCGTLSLTDSGKKYITGDGTVKECWFIKKR